MKISKAASTQMTAAGIDASLHETLYRLKGRAAKAGRTFEELVGLTQKHGLAAIDCATVFLAPAKKAPAKKAAPRPVRAAKKD